jgi:hypothetical protein
MISAPFPEMQISIDKNGNGFATFADPAPNWVLYVMVKPLSSMNKGKAMAHTGHACCDFAFKYGDCKEVKEWRNQSPQKTFGTQLNVKWDEKIINDIEECDTIISGFVVDDTYPYRVPTTELKDLIAFHHHTETPSQNKDGSWTCYRKATTAYYFLTTKDAMQTAGYKFDLED